MLASTQVQVISMGWKFVPIVLLDSTLMVMVALLFNNVLRQYPMYWWTPATVGRKLKRERRERKRKKRKKGKCMAGMERIQRRRRGRSLRRRIVAVIVHFNEN